MSSVTLSACNCSLILALIFGVSTGWAQDFLEKEPSEDRLAKAMHVPFAPFARRGDWHQFQFSASHTGYNPYENRLNPANVSSLTLLWSTNSVSPIASGPVVAGGIVYASGTDTKLYAFNARSGAQLWSRAGGGGMPVVASGLAYVAASDGKLNAFDARTGAKRWSVPGGGLPVVANGLVYANGPDGNLTAFNARTGAKRWTAAVDGTPAVANGAVYVAVTPPNSEGYLYAFDAKRGIQRWQTALQNCIVYSNAIRWCATQGFVSLGGDAPPGVPMVADGVVYIALQSEKDLPDEPQTPGSILAFDALTGALRWSSPLPEISEGSCGTVSTTSAGATANGVAYFFIGAAIKGGCFGFTLQKYADLQGLDARNGQVVFRAGPPPSAPVSASVPVIANGLIYAANSYCDGDIGLYSDCFGVIRYQLGAFNIQTGEQVLSLVLPHESDTYTLEPYAPVVAHGRVYISSGGHLYAYGPTFH